MPIQLSGSLVITGSITTTGVILMSGSIASASYSSTSDLLQGTGSVGFATTASLLAVSSSQQQISASLLNVVANYATTGSNSFRANQSITGSLVVSSTITAQTLVVQTVTSSIVYSSGSNNFGNQLSNNQTFTGSVNITGSLALAGNITGNAITLIGALSGTSANFNSTLTAAGATINGNATISVNHNSLTRLIISNTTAGSSAYVETSFTSDSSAGAGSVGKFGSSTTPYKITTASNTYLYNSSVAGDIAILNDFSSGAIKMAAGGSSTSHFTIASTGAATFASSIAATSATFSGNVAINGTIIGTDQTFGGAYRTFAFGTNANGFNRIFAANDTSDGLYLNAATGRGIYFRVNGGGSNVVSIDSAGAATFSGKVFLNTTTAYTSELNVQAIAANRPAIKAGYGGVTGNGYWILGDNYTTDESLMAIGIDYSSGGLVLGSALAPSTTTSGAFISTQAQFGGYGSAIKLGTGGDIIFYNGTQNSVIAAGSAKTASVALTIAQTGAATFSSSVTNSGNLITYKSGGGGNPKQVVVGQTTAAASGTAKKIAYVGFSHSVRVYVWANQSAANGSSAIADFTTLYGASSGGTTSESNYGNVSDIVVTYDNGGSPAYTINVTLVYTGTAPTINYVVEGISHDNNIYAI